MASADRDLLDRHGLAGHGPVHRSRHRGREPKGQRLGVNVLFVALILVVGGSLTGEWLGIKQKLGIFTGRSYDRGVKVKDAAPVQGGTVRLAPANKAVY